MEEIITFLEQKPKILLEFKNSNINRVVLFLGNTSAGKTALWQILYGDNDKLKSIETNKNSNEFVIKDEHNLIGYEVISTTIQPQGIFDSSNNIAYVDSHGFEDTRNFKYDMIGNYMLKSVLTVDKQVKFILVTNYSSVRKGNDIIDFMKMLRHVTVFINNIYNFKDSILLVVSKVDNVTIEGPDGLQYMSDGLIKNNIALYIEDVRKTILNNPSYFVENDFNQKALLLIDEILRNNSNHFENIVLLPRPSSCGNLTGIRRIQEGKRNIINAVNRLKFSKIDSDSFSYTISEESKRCIYDVVITINKHMEKIMLNLNEYMYKSLNLQANKYVNEYDLKSEIHKFYYFLKDITFKLSNSTDMKSFIINILPLLINLNNENLKLTFSKMVSYHHYLQFLRNINNGKNLELQISKWVKPLERILQNIQQRLDWSNFILDIYENLSSYEMYKNYQAIRNLEIISEDNVKKFTDLFKKIKEYNYSLTTENFENLNFLVDMFMKTPQITYDKETRILKIEAELYSIHDLNNIVDKYSQVEEIYIFAYNTLFINEDFIPNDAYITVAMIAPNWEIFGNRKIVLDGIDGKQHEQSKADLNKNGEAGLPGGPGGCFFGLGESIIHNGHLTVSSIGGNGGNGQDGGDGSSGKDGNPEESAENITNLINKNISKESIMQMNHFTDYLQILLGVTRYIDTETLSIVSAGENGKDGGIAGAKGAGGYKGIVRFFGFKSNNGISKKCEDGKDGKPGVGGKGGEAGKTINLYRTKNMQKMYLFHMEIDSTYLGIKNRKETSEQSINALPGKNCTRVSAEIERMVSRYLLKDVKLCQIIRQYKLFILNNLKHKYRSNKLKPFYNLLTNHLEIQNLYDAPELIKELYHLELYTHKYGESDDLLVLYKTLLERIERYREYNKKDNKNLLKYIQAATFSKILTIEDRHHNHLIIDMNKYFKCIETNLKDLITSSKEKLIQLHFDNYTASFNKNLDDATSFLNEISSKFEMNVINLREHINYLENDMKTLKTSSKQLNTAVDNDKILAKVAYEQDLCSFFNFIKHIFNNIFEIGKNSLNELIRQNICTKIMNLVSQSSDRNLFELIDIGFTLFNIALQAIETFNNDDFISTEYTKVTENYATYKAFIKENEKKLKDNLNKYNKTEKNYVCLRECFIYICKILLPLYSELYESVKNGKGSEIYKWNVQLSLKHLRSLIIKLKLDNDSLYLINIIIDGIDCIILIYDQIKEYTDQYKMVEYIKNLHSTSNAVGVSGDHQRVFTDLTLIIKCNTVLRQYKDVLASFKHHVFPFANFYLKELDVPYYNLQDMNIDTWVQNINDQIKYLRGKIISNNCVVNTNIDRHLYDTKFVETCPFYTWNKETYTESIAQLLSGEKIILKANITENNHSDKYAIKFKTAHIKLISTDEKVNTNLENFLENHQVSLTHHGNSHYLYKNNFYEINSESLTFNYSYQLENGQPITTNDVYRKIKDGRFMFSPYATWSLQLKCTPDKIDVVLRENLMNYIGQIHMVLIGHGQYISENDFLSTQDVQKYYQSMEMTANDLIQVPIM